MVMLQRKEPTSQPTNEQVFMATAETSCASVRVCVRNGECE